MKYDHLRDYATNGFRTYAAAGKPTHVYHRDPPLFDDVSAATLAREWLCATTDGVLTWQCVDIVYFTLPNIPLRNRDVADRVRYAAHTLHMDERSVYRRLKTARQLFAKARGLNEICR